MSANLSRLNACTWFSDKAKSLKSKLSMNNGWLSMSPLNTSASSRFPSDCSLSLSKHRNTNRSWKRIPVRTGYDRIIVNYCAQYSIREAKKVMSKNINPYNKVIKQNVPPYIKYTVESSYGMWNWIVDGLTNYFNFNGRARRKAFWYFSLANITFLIMARIAQVTQVMPSDLTNLIELITIALAIPMVSVTARRLHDVGRSGFMQLIAFIPFLGLFILIYFLCQDTAPETNQWGLPAKQMH